MFWLCKLMKSGLETSGESWMIGLYGYMVRFMYVEGERRCSICFICKGIERTQNLSYPTEVGGMFLQGSLVYGT